MEYKYKISVVIPVYNVEKYLEETLKSVINQTINFKKNIQVILINDGSKDDSEKICLKYQKKYPENIEYYSKGNAGVSATRNEGIKYIKGKYVNFLDSDDKFDLNAYEKAYNMLENNQEIDLVAFRLKYFEASKKYHWLDYKFDADRIVDIMSEPQNILLHINSSVIRTEALEGLKFDERLKISEDTKLLYELIFKKQKYGIISSSKYNYRKRKDETSAIQTSRRNKEWYTKTFKYCHDFLIETSKNKFGEVIKYVQHFLMYDIKWRIQSVISGVINEEEQKIYVNKIKEYLENIDYDVILFQQNMSLYYKMLALKIKSGENINKLFDYKNDGIYIEGTLFTTYEQMVNNIEISYIRKNMLTIEGNIFLNSYDFYYKINGKDRKKIDTYVRNNANNIFVQVYNVSNDGYRIEIPLEDVNTIEFEVNINGNYYVIKNNFIHFSNINNFKAGYYYKNQYLITKKNEKSKIIIKHKPFGLKVLLREIIFLLYITFNKRKIKVAMQRAIYWITKPFMPKNIWLFADREFMARDSAEQVFKYTNSQENLNNRKTYFAVDKNTEDYRRMKKYGKVVGYHTLKYKLLFLNAKYLISSHADGYVNNEFGGSRRFYVDLYRFKYIYLTHGVLLHDSSAWLNRINKNIELNVVTSPMEYQSILDENYYFKPEQLIKTGLPRNDKLFDSNIKEENKILIMASWRSSLTGPVIPGTQKREYNPKFKKSEYFNFYNDLFNDKKLQEAFKKYNYKIKFCIHPSFRAQLKDFKGNEFVEVAIDVDSQYETVSSKVLITDYSSAACDFAYLRKPVIYANFDLDHIYDIHYYNKGYFDYDIHGFGQNCKTYDDTINEIIKTIENNCEMEEKYKQRCDKFFYHNDNNSAKRVYEALIEHEKNTKE